MGKYINTGSDGFRRARAAEYVDKSMLIPFINSTLGTEQSMTCVTRARRFGKSMAAKMLCAYYDQSCDSRELFKDLKVAQDPDFECHLNQYPVIYLDMTYFLTTCPKGKDIVDYMSEEIRTDLCREYPDVEMPDYESLTDTLLRLSTNSGKMFYMVIDEWDAICRELGNDKEAMKRYVDWLRSMFKTANSDRIFAGVYMTGILPIKQYDTQSALNNFVHYSMIDPEPISGYFGFTENEVRHLCSKHNLSFEQMSYWYDGYRLGRTDAIFNPNSVMMAIRKQNFGSYWEQTGAYEGLRRYITMNFDGLRDAIVRLISGDKVRIDVGSTNDLHDVNSRDEVLTTLIHLGYLSFEMQSDRVYIPNYEVRKEFEKSIKDTGWTEVMRTIQESEHLLHAIIQGEEDIVASAVDRVHAENTSVLQYNDENSLSNVLSLAFYAARGWYSVIRELPAGLGFADIVLLPKKGVNRQAMVLELKWDKSADTAIRQIKEKRYAGVLSDFADEIVLVAINYDKKSKKHECKIERLSSIVPSLSQVCPKSVPSLPKVLNGLDVPVLKTILERTEAPVGIDVLMRVTEQTNRSRFRTTYITPLLMEEYVVMTQPDKPTSSKQQYYRTKKGADLLEAIKL